MKSGYPQNPIPLRRTPNFHTIYPGSILGLTAPHRPPTPTSQNGTPAMQVLVVWTKDVGDFGFSSEDRAFAFKVIRLVGQAAGF